MFCMLLLCVLLSKHKDVRTEAEEMAQKLKVSAALTGDQISVPSTHARWLTST